MLVNSFCQTHISKGIFVLESRATSSMTKLSKSCQIRLIAQQLTDAAIFIFHFILIWFVLKLYTNFRSLVHSLFICDRFSWKIWNFGIYVNLMNAKKYKSRFAPLKYKYLVHIFYCFFPPIQYQKLKNLVKNEHCIVKEIGKQIFSGFFLYGNCYEMNLKSLQLILSYNHKNMVMKSLLF